MAASTDSFIHSIQETEFYQKVSQTTWRSETAGRSYMSLNLTCHFLSGMGMNPSVSPFSHLKSLKSCLAFTSTLSYASFNSTFKSQLSFLDSNCHSSSILFQSIKVFYSTKRSPRINPLEKILSQNFGCSWWKCNSECLSKHRWR